MLAGHDNPQHIDTHLEFLPSQSLVETSIDLILKTEI
jgi:hypothetical protein